MIIGIGTDIVQIDRIDLKIANRILTKDELEIYNLLDVTKKEWLAGRFAAKEAVYKALPDENKINIDKISIVSENNRPVCFINDYVVHISISHEKSYAIAYVIIEK